MKKQVITIVSSDDGKLAEASQAMLRALGDTVVQSRISRYSEDVIDTIETTTVIFQYMKPQVSMSCRKPIIIPLDNNIDDKYSAYIPLYNNIKLN